MSAPCSIGRHRYGVTVVASTTSGMPCGVGDVREPRRCRHLAARVGDDLGEDQLGLGCDRRGELVGFAAGHERRVHAEAAQRHVELRHGAAVETGRGDDVVARTGEGGEREELGRLTARRRHGADARPPGWPTAPPSAFDRRVADAAVDRCRTSAVRTGSPRPRCRRTRSSSSGRSAPPARRWRDQESAGVDGTGAEAETPIRHDRGLPSGAWPRSRGSTSATTDSPLDPPFPASWDPQPRT